MPIELIIVSYNENEAEEIFRLWEVEENPLNTDEWVKATTTITLESLQKKYSNFEILLCIRGDLLITEFDFIFIERVLESVINRLWGAQIYIVVDRSIEQTDWYNLRLLLNAALKYGVSDIFEVGTEDEIFLRDLRNYEADISQIINSIRKMKESRIISLDYLTISGWECVIPRNSILPGEHIIPFGKNEVSSVNDSSLLIYCAGDENYAKAFVDKNLIKYKTRICFIANINYCLDEKTKSEFLNSGIKSVDFVGYVDLNYYLQKLNQKRVLLNNSAIHQKIDLLKEHLFTPFKIPKNPRVLIVNAFLPSEELFQDVAKEVGHLKKSINNDAEIEIYPAIDFSILPDIIERNPLTVLIFQGHGEDGKIKDMLGNYHTPEELLKRFTKYKSGLSLFFFASCKSAEFARLFASHGTGVAIGFQEKVTCFETSIIAEEVVPVALRNKNGVNLVDEILRAFQKAMDTLISRNLESVKPIAYYSHR
jgi:hypothetical protein